MPRDWLDSFGKMEVWPELGSGSIGWEGVAARRFLDKYCLQMEFLNHPMHTLVSCFTLSAFSPLTQGLSLSLKLGLLPASSSNPPVSTPLRGIELKAHVTTPGFLHGCWGFELGSLCFRTGDDWVGGSGVHRHLWLWSQFKASLCYLRPCPERGEGGWGGSSARKILAAQT